MIYAAMAAQLVAYIRMETKSGCRMPTLGVLDGIAGLKSRAVSTGAERGTFTLSIDGIAIPSLCGFVFARR